MNEIIYMVFVLTAGVVLGILFFGGLWFTVKKVVTSKRPALWLIGSFIIRVSITLVGFYYLSQGSWKNLLISVLGFIIARSIIIHHTKSNEEKTIQLKKQSSHEAKS
ncbi:MAG TPA: ATP synthase subunit I [Salegentibacter sp.]|uniref:ATP synthase subunit I n=1 Tax=Salegentibacter sp. TaxID=1903072 RepID=UPI002F95B218